MARAPLWFKVVSVLAILWNLVGVFAFVSEARMGPDELAQLSDAQQAMFAARPAWAPVVTGIATIVGTIGSIGLLLGKRWALVAFGVSLVALVIQDAGILSLPGRLIDFGTVPLVLQSFVLVIAIGLVVLARKGIARGWLT